MKLGTKRGEWDLAGQERVSLRRWLDSSHAEERQDEEDQGMSTGFSFWGILVRAEVSRGGGGGDQFWAPWHPSLLCLRQKKLADQGLMLVGTGEARETSGALSVHLCTVCDLPSTQ